MRLGFQVLYSQVPTLPLSPYPSYHYQLAGDATLASGPASQHTALIRDQAVPPRLYRAYGSQVGGFLLPVAYLLLVLTICRHACTGRTARR